MGAQVEGVVDPIRWPDGLARAWRATPPLARVSLGLAVGAYLMRLLPWITSVSALDGGFVSWIQLTTGGPLATAALVALPGALLVRRADAATVSRPILLGALVLAVTAFPYPDTWLAPAIRAAFPDDVDYSNAWGVIAILGSIAAAAGWLAVAYGLRRLETPPSPRVALLAAAGAVAYAGPSLIEYVAFYGRAALFDAPDIAGTLLSIGANLGGLVAGAAMTWAVIRGLDDPRRPQLARRLAVAAQVVLVAAMTLWLGPALLGGTAGSSPWSPTLPIGPWATVALVVAFGLGLADPREAEPADAVEAPARYLAP